MRKSKLEILREISREQDSIDKELDKLEELEYTDEEEGRILDDIDKRIKKVDEDLAAVNEIKNQDGYFFYVIVPFALLFFGIAIHKVGTYDHSASTTPIEVQSCIKNINAISQHSTAITQGELTIDLNLDSTESRLETAEKMCSRELDIRFAGVISPSRP